MWECVVDLSQPFYHNCPGASIPPLTRVQKVSIAARDGFNLEMLEVSTHSGTHLDAPYHFLEEGATIDKIAPEMLMGPGAVFDLLDSQEDRPIDASLLKQRRAAPNKGTVALLCTGWGAKRSFRSEYLLHPPYLTPDGAQYLLEHGVKGVGIDHFSLAGNEAEKTVPVHKLLLGAGIWIAEDLLLPPALLERDDWYVVALPLLLRGGSGAPARVVAMAPAPAGSSSR